MNTKELALIVIAIIIAGCIIGGCIYAGLASNDSSDNNNTIANNTTNVTNKNVTNTSSDEGVQQSSQSSKSDHSSSSSKYEQREAGLYNTETGRYEGGQADGCSQEYVDQYKYDMEHGATGKYVTVDPYG